MKKMVSIACIFLLLFSICQYTEGLNYYSIQKALSSHSIPEQEIQEINVGLNQEIDEKKNVERIVFENAVTQDDVIKIVIA